MCKLKFGQSFLTRKHFNWVFHRTFGGRMRFCKKCFLSSIILFVLFCSLIVLVNAEPSWVVWSKTFGGTSTDQAYSLVETSDGGYALTGSTTTFGFGNSDVWLVKTDGSGNKEWNRNYGGEVNDSAYSLIQMSDGGFALAGETESYGAGDYDFWLIRTNVQGIPEFSSWIILPISLATTLFALIIKKRMFNQSS
jgi:hypothetical protein